MYLEGRIFGLLICFVGSVFDMVWISMFGGALMVNFSSSLSQMSIWSLFSSKFLHLKT